LTPPPARELVEAVRVGLAAQADPVRAAGTQAYMKSAMPYYGVRMPALRTLLRDVFEEFPLPDVVAWRGTVLTLWDQARYREERYAALELLGARRYRQFQTLEAVPLYEYLIVSGAWWDLVDDVATHRVGDLLRAVPEPMRPIVLGWSRHDDHWLRRTSIICQVGSKGLTDQDLLFACIEPSLHERDFFLRKGIGWALREYSKTSPAAVRAYVAEHADRLSALSRREALRLLPA
jgi:3-methyladenine DNA glycosylase AlkD